MPERGQMLGGCPREKETGASQQGRGMVSGMAEGGEGSRGRGVSRGDELGSWKRRRPRTRAHSAQLMEDGESSKAKHSGKRADPPSTRLGLMPERNLVAAYSYAASVALSVPTR